MLDFGKLGKLADITDSCSASHGRDRGSIPLRTAISESRIYDCHRSFSPERFPPVFSATF